MFIGEDILDVVPVFVWRNALPFPKNSDKIVDILKTALVGDNRDRKGRFHKQRLGPCQSRVGQVLLGTVSGLLLEAPGEIVLADKVV